MYYYLFSYDTTYENKHLIYSKMYLSQCTSYTERFIFVLQL